MDSNKRENGSSKKSRFIDLSLPEDKKPMPLSDYKKGKRWGWVEVDSNEADGHDDDHKRNKYSVAGKSLERNAAYWLEQLAKESEKKSIRGEKKKASLNNTFFQCLLHPVTTNKACTIGKRTVAIGTKDEIYVTGDFGLLGAVLEAYNHHWNLKVSPDDFWIPIAVRISSKINDAAKNIKVRDFFVNFEGKKEIVIRTNARSIYDVDYIWLFDQFSEIIKENIKKDEYIELMTSNFSTTTPVSKIASQINIMSSLQEYFEYTMTTRCGIKGVEMLGNLEDWKQLVEKIDKLTELLSPLEVELGISKWLKDVRMIYVKLVETFENNPDQDWWSRIISKVPFGSGGPTRYVGWIIQFLEGNRFYLLICFAGE